MTSKVLCILCGEWSDMDKLEPNRPTLQVCEKIECLCQMIAKTPFLEKMDIANECLVLSRWEAWLTD